MRFIEIWTNNEEKELLKRLDNPTRLASLSEHDQFRIEALVRKDLVIKDGWDNPMVVANHEKIQKEK